MILLKYYSIGEFVKAIGNITQSFFRIKARNILEFEIIENLSNKCGIITEIIANTENEED